MPKKMAVDFVFRNKLISLHSKATEASYNFLGSEGRFPLASASVLYLFFYLYDCCSKHRPET